MTVPEHDIAVERFCCGALQANCYWVTDIATGAMAIIDPGTVTPQLSERLQVDGSAVQYILLTHGHFDHIMGAAECQRRTGAKVYIHKADAPCLQDDGRSLLRDMMPSCTCEPVAADVLLNGGETFSLGSSMVSVLHTAGHSSGCVCYQIGSNLFCGDLLFEGSIGRTDFWDGDAAAMRESLNRVSAFPGDVTVWPGHGRKTTIENERRTNPYLGANGL